MRQIFGPEPQQAAPVGPARTCPTSPNPGVVSLKELGLPELETGKKAKSVPLSEEISSLLVKTGLTEQSLIAMSEPAIYELKNVSSFEQSQLVQWRVALLDKGVAEDIFKLIDDFNGSEFNKKE